MLGLQRTHCRAALGPARHSRARAVRVRAAAFVPRPESEPHLQLGTAKIPSDILREPFAEYIYQWSATITQSGANLPLILPLRADKVDGGFALSLLKRMPEGNFDAAGIIQGTLEDVPGKGPIFFIRFFEGPAGLVDRRTAPPANPQERLDVVLQGLPDVEVLVSTMPNALRAGVVRFRP